ncbi:hypothetical protein D2962_09395 [Biomaibacter acetigenes]|uniref:Tail fiber protein n=1 Tax=Biomaibacter acetigenes TaxID=2316383 RepID=A0A3G2R613_9FIRM|nr:hypothetical protein [Biomaibacter acetigenes]AYO30795.1 hypothetical protein D2962_09395 [Biomaibacter acetigenes]
MPELTPKLGIKKPLGNETVSRAAFNENYDIIDANAQKNIIQGSTAPVNPVVDDLWIDTSTTPHSLKKWNGTTWQKIGAVTWDDISGKPSSFLPTVHGNEAHDPDLALASDLAAHLAETAPHGATSAATASKIMMRDVNGRAKVAAPLASDDIARKDTVDAVQTNLNTHAALTSTAHGATNAATASTLMARDASGRAKVAAPAASDDIAIKSTVDAVQTNLNTHKTSSDHDGRYYTESEVNALLAEKMNNTKAYGNVAYTDSIAASSTLTKTIALGGTYKHGHLVINPSSSDLGIMVFFGTDNMKSLVTGTVTSTDWRGGAWSRELLGCIAVGNPSTGPGKGVTGASPIGIDDVYINGSNIVIVFHNYATSAASLNCTINWEVW